MVGIYRIINPKGKIYIGQSTNILKRKSSYKGYRCKDQISIYRSLKKYGFEKHKFDIIEECNVNELQSREIYWKKHYLDKVNNKWDQVLFCKLDDGPGGYLSEEIKDKISKANKGKKRSKSFGEGVKKRRLGTKHSEETIIKMSKPRSIPSSLKGTKQSKTHIEKRISKIRGIPKDPTNYFGKGGRKIIQYDLENQFVKAWGSIKEAEDIYGKGIKSVLAKKGYTASGFIWRYEGEPLPSNYKIPKHPNRKSLIQYDLEGNFIKEWGSTIEVQKTLGYSNSNISTNAIGKSKTAYGYKWKYKE